MFICFNIKEIFSINDIVNKYGFLPEYSRTAMHNHLVYYFSNPSEKHVSLLGFYYVFTGIRDKTVWEWGNNLVTSINVFFSYFIDHYITFLKYRTQPQVLKIPNSESPLFYVHCRNAVAFYKCNYYHILLASRIQLNPVSWHISKKKVMDEETEGDISLLRTHVDL